MLFLLKRTPGPALLAALGLTALGLAARAGLQPARPEPPAAEAALRAALGLGAIVASDAGVHLVLALAFAERYLRRFGALVELFAGQTALAILAGGALAGAEEVIFRGVILEGLRAPLGEGPALIVAAVLFAAAHHVPRPGFAAFTAWSVWEGALLGGVYLASGSLVFTAIAHALHDIGGFTAFAAIRRLRAAPGIMPLGRLLPPREPDERGASGA